MERMLDIEITRRCNLRCDYCFVGWSRDWTQDLARDVAHEVIREGAAFFDILHLTGGEPFARRDIFELIELGLHCGYRSILINSNGTMLTPADIERLGSYESKVALSISLDGPPHLHDQVRGDGRFAQADAAISALLAAGVPVTVMTVVTRAVLEILPSFLAERSKAHRGLSGITLFPVGVGPDGSQKPGVALDSLTSSDVKHLAACVALAWRSGIRVSVGAYPVINPLLRELGYPTELLYQCTAGRGRICVHADQGVSSCHPVKNPVYGRWASGLFGRLSQLAIHETLARRDFEGCRECDHNEECGHCRAFVTASGEDILGNDRICHEIVPGKSGSPPSPPKHQPVKSSPETTLISPTSLVRMSDQKKSSLVYKVAEVMFAMANIRELDNVVSEDFHDANPVILQPPGREGLYYKVAFWRAERPLARSYLLEVEPTQLGARAHWETHEGPGLPTTKWRGNFEMSRGRIRSFEVERVG